jgi:hypothetical protein
MLRGTKFLATLAASAMLFFGASSLKAADTGTITGTVTGKDGKPAAGVAVRLMKPGQGGPGRPGGAGGPPKADAPKPEPKADEPKPGEKPAPPPGGGGNRPPPIKEAKTDDAGKFTMTEVPAGEYTIAAGGRDIGFGREMVTVKAGETATVSITLKEGRPGGGGKPGGAGGKPPEKPADGAK